MGCVLSVCGGQPQPISRSIQATATAAAQCSQRSSRSDIQHMQQQKLTTITQCYAAAAAAACTFFARFARFACVLCVRRSETVTKRRDKATRWACALLLQSLSATCATRIVQTCVYVLFANAHMRVHADDKLVNQIGIVLNKSVVVCEWVCVFFVVFSSRSHSGRVHTMCIYTYPGIKTYCTCIYCI